MNYFCSWEFCKGYSSYVRSRRSRLNRISNNPLCLRTCMCLCVHILVWIFRDSFNFQRVKVSLSSVWMHIHEIDCVYTLTSLWWIEKFRFHLTLHCWSVFSAGHSLTGSCIITEPPLFVCFWWALCPMCTEHPNFFHCQCCAKRHSSNDVCSECFISFQNCHIDRNHFWAKVHFWSQAALRSLNKLDFVPSIVNYLKILL